MTLPTFKLITLINQQLSESGIDSREYCRDIRHWRSYPTPVAYSYNSRGYRDQEWPEDLSQVIWCFGDSFTAGIGVPYNHIWPQLLEKQSGIRTINVSMDGASNNWIARKITELARELTPATVVIQWSYTNRREHTGISQVHKTANAQWSNLYNSVKDSAWPDCNDVVNFDSLPEFIQKEILDQHATAVDREIINSRHYLAAILDESRRIHYAPDFSSNNPNTIACIEQVQAALPTTRIIHSFIPEFSDSADEIIEHLKSQNYCYIEPIVRLDLARDGFHYDIKTAEQFCANVVKLI